jgi:hypothetical protein
MGNSRALIGHKDILEILRQAEAGPVQVMFNNDKTAAYFVARCNSFRGLDRKRNAQEYEVGHPLHPYAGHGESAFDALRISRAGNAVTIMAYEHMQYDVRDLATGEPIQIGKPMPVRTIPELEVSDPDTNRWSAAQKPGEKLF